MRAFYLLLAILTIGCSTSSQTVTTKTAKKKALALYEQADYAFVMGKIDEAESLFKEVLQLEPDLINAHNQLGDLYFMYRRNYSEARGYYSRVVELDKTFDHQAFLKLGLCEFYTDQFEAAKKSLTEYLSKAAVRGRNRHIAEQCIENCEFVPKAMANPVKAEITNIGPGVNSAASEYFPALTADESRIYYTVSVIEGGHGQEDIYSSRKVDGQWTDRRKVAGQVNTGFGNEGAHTISPDGMYLLFTACNWPEGVGGCDIYVSRKDGEQWKKPINMGLNINSKAKDTQPSISADGREIFFVSNRSGGIGGLDIYVSTLVDSTNRYGKPVNLGNVINTPLEEERPFIHPDGRTLFFASEGHPGFGEFDLFMSQRDAQGKWSEPVNLGYPINTKHFERGMHTSADGVTAFYASQRDDSRGEIDIYQFKLPESARPQPATYITGTVTDKETGQPIDTKIQLQELESGKLVSSAWSDGADGSFLVTIPTGRDYAYSVQKTGYLFHSEYFSLPDGTPEGSFELHIKLERIKAGNKVVLKNIFFDTGEYILKPRSQSEINRMVGLLSKNPEMRIEIGGHTDDVGSAADNQLLSENRAKAVYDALLKNGIAAERLSYKGYGMTQPLVANDNDENRARNRRTEFKVLQ